MRGAWRALTVGAWLFAALPSPGHLGAQEAPAAQPPSVRLGAWGAALPLDPGVLREMARFQKGGESVEAGFAQAQARRMREALIREAREALGRIQEGGCRPAVEVTFPSAESWEAPQMGPGERGFLEGLVRTEAMACFRAEVGPGEALDLFTSPAFRMEAESRIERMWTEGEATCMATGGVPILLAPTQVCNRVTRLMEPDLAAEHSQVVRNGSRKGLQPVFFKESLKTFVRTPDGLALVYINYSRSTDLGAASRWVASKKVAESEESQIAALRKRIEG